MPKQKTTAEEYLIAALAQTKIISRNLSLLLDVHARFRRLVELKLTYKDVLNLKALLDHIIEMSREKIEALDDKNSKPRWHNTTN